MPDAIDILTIEVGSTITKVNAFVRAGSGALDVVAQGFAATSVANGDVAVGVEQAIEDLKAGHGDLNGHPETFVNSSAAGGLRMTVHGLTASMTARAAKEASLGAGAIVKMLTAGELSNSDLQEIRAISPNIILLAGGVDFGEKAIVLDNAEKLASLKLQVPVLYAGNIAIRTQIRDIFNSSGIELLVADNVFPEVDVLDVEPLRRVIHDVFSQHIIRAPGMARLTEITQREILPTPGAVLKGAELFCEVMGDCLVFDVGGATTDVHSVTDGNPEYSSMLVEPEPRAKRTVEGDLGVFINAANIMEMAGDDTWKSRIGDLQAIPHTEREKELTRWLCARAVEVGIRRHAGTVSALYTPTGRKQIIKGKDLTRVKWVIATGGALTRIQGASDCLRSVCTGAGKYLLPPRDARVLIDRRYLFSALGTIAQAYPVEVKKTFERWACQDEIQSV